MTATTTPTPASVRPMIDSREDNTTRLLCSLWAERKHNRRLRAALAAAGLAIAAQWVVLVIVFRSACQ